MGSNQTTGRWMMRESGRWARFGWVTSGALVAVLAHEVGRARAGVPVKVPLVYSGYLTDASGEPVEDTKTMSVPLYADESSTTSLCPPTDPPNEAEVKAGRFSIALADACAAAVHGNADALVELEVEGTKLLSNEVVRVGIGSSAFWADRYESGLYSGPDVDAIAMLMPSADVLEVVQVFPTTGQWLGSTAPFHSESRRGVKATTNITWFQAAACRVSGKRLPSAEEWLAAARGTHDPGANDGQANGKCNTYGAATRMTGINNPMPNTSCVSSSSAYWSNWSSNLLQDHVPVAAYRDGGLNGDGAGLFAIALDSAPSRESGST